MDGIHDMGGTQGFGAVSFTPDEPGRVDDRWEAVAGAAVFALLRSGRTNLDAHRHRIERIDPRRYLPITYWGRWLAAVEAAIDEQEIAPPDAVANAVRQAGADPDRSAPPALGPVVALESRENGRTARREIDSPPRFAVGDLVRTSAHAPHAGHHRLPRYARGRQGTIARVYPAFVLPDATAHGRGEQPCHVYAVAFDGTELWGADAEPGLRCHLDVFEPYLSGADEVSEES
ncbi:MAG: nitrile hydratase subunit beta [Actinomycetota bacterium]